MNIEPENGCYAAANDSPAPERRKSPGRVAAARRLNDSGLRGVGGRPPTHELRALEAMLSRGQTPEGLAGIVLAEYQAQFSGDFDESIAAKEKGGCRRLSELELFAALVKARLTTPAGVLRRLPWKQEKEIIAVGVSVAEAYSKMCAALGWKRRERELPDAFEYIRRGGNGTNESPASERPAGAQEPEP